MVGEVGREAASSSKNAEFVKPVTGGPTAKAFNSNFASLFHEISDARTRSVAVTSAPVAAYAVVPSWIEDFVNAVLTEFVKG